MRSNVRVVNVPQKQQKMNTEELFYDKQKAMIYTDRPSLCKSKRPPRYLTGYGLTANQNFSRYRILKPEGIFTVAGAVSSPSSLLRLALTSKPAAKLPS